MNKLNKNESCVVSLPFRFACGGRKLLIIPVLPFIVLLSLGVFFRFWNLGGPPFPADEMEFYKLALSNRGILDLWRNPPWLNQMPLNEIFTLLLVKVGLPASPFVTRLPFAVMGALALVMLWRFVSRYFGAVASCVVLFLAIFNPYQLYYSRTAYHYAGVTCWSVAMVLSFWGIRDALVQKHCPSLRKVALWGIAALLACHMHMSVWIVAAVQGALLFGMGLLALRHSRSERIRYVLMMVLSALVLVAVMSRWIYRAVRMMVDSTEQLGASVSDELMRLFPAYFAGENLLAVMLLIGIAGIALVAAWRARKTQDPFWSFSWIAGLHIVALMLYVGFAGGGVGKISYFSSIWPFFICFLGIGLWNGLEFVSGGRKGLLYGALVLILAAYVGLTLRPAWAIVTLDGKPLPTFKINDWVMKNLPPGTPILVDHWLFPWNHLAIHNTDQINYTFTVPDDPVENYRALGWRATASAFFEKYPDAAFLEVDRDKYIDKVGPWHFPLEQFARIASLTNEPVMLLRRYGVIPTAEYAAANTNQVVTRLFYNTTDDVISATRRSGKSVLLLYGEGWRYLKPWQPMQGWPEQLMQTLWIQSGMYGEGRKTVASLNDLQKISKQQAMLYLNQGRWADYRVPGTHSPLRLFNLTEQDLPATLMVTAIALSGHVRCMIGDQIALFPQTLLTERRLPVTLKPGETQIVVAMPMNQFLLVNDVRLVADVE